MAKDICKKVVLLFCSGTYSQHCTPIMTILDRLQVLHKIYDTEQRKERENDEDDKFKMHEKKCS